MEHLVLIGITKSGLSTFEHEGYFIRKGPNSVLESGLLNFVLGVAYTDVHTDEQIDEQAEGLINR